MRSVSASSPQLDPAKFRRSATCNISFLRTESRCWWNVGDLSSVTPKYFGSGQNGKDWRSAVIFSSRVEIKSRHSFSFGFSFLEICSYLCSCLCLKCPAVILAEVELCGTRDSAAS